MSLDIKSEISKIVNGFSQLPYLFVGTGISMRYSTAPSWNDLLYKIWSKVNCDDKLKYRKFVRKVSFDLGLNNDTIDCEQKKYLLNPEIASRIQEEFNKKFFNDDIFEKEMFSNDELICILDNDYDPFKFYISKLTKEITLKSSNENYSELDKLIKNQNKIAGVITTNYDLILENIFKDFEVMIGQDNMLTSNIGNLFEIFKIHGSAKEPSSIVITTNDYKYFKQKLKYLSAKLLTIFVEHPIIFLGYSISDVNIREIIKEISECLNSKQIEQLKNTFIFVTPSEDLDEITCKEIDFGSKRIKMTEIKLKDYSNLYEELGSIKSSMPIKVIRKMQDMICNFIATTTPTKNIMVGNIDNPNFKGDDIGIYIGGLEVVSEMGFDFYGIEDIIEDIIFDNKPNLMNKKLIDKTFKNIRSLAGKTYLPVYKYIKGLNININTLPKEWCILYSLNSLRTTTTDDNYVKNGESFNSVEDIQKTFSNHIPKQLAYILHHVKNGKIKIDDLENFLRSSFNDKKTYGKYSSQIKKLVAAYDLMKYK